MFLNAAPAKARLQLYLNSEAAAVKVMSLPPIEKNLYLHTLRAHMAVMLVKAAD